MSTTTVWEVGPAGVDLLEAVQARAGHYQREIVPLVSRLGALAHESDEVGTALLLVAQILALEELRMEAIGAGPASWEDGLQRHHVIQRETIDLLKKHYRMEAVN